MKTMKKKSTNVRRLTDEREFEVRHLGNNKSGNPVTEEWLNSLTTRGPGLGPYIDHD